MNLNQVTIPTADLQKSIDFYQTMGLELIVHAPPRYARFLCPDGQATFSLHLVEEVLPNPHYVIYFECADLHQKVATLKQDGIIFKKDPTDENWLWREARLFDPFGNQICLYFAGENRINPPWKV